MIILPGNNKLVYCEKALLAIIEAHLNSNMTLGFREDSVKVRVTSVVKEDNVFSFSVTTDKEAQ